MAPLSDAQRALKIVEIQIDALSSTCQYQDECKALSQLLQATSGILQYWQDNSIQDAKVKSAGQLLRFALAKVARVSAACAVEASELGASTAAPTVDVPAEATSAAADIQLAVSALATALQWDQASQHNKLRAAGRTSQRLSTAAQMTNLLAAEVQRFSEAGSLTGSAQMAAHMKAARVSGSGSPFGHAAAAAAAAPLGMLSSSGSGGSPGRRSSNSSTGGSAQQRARASSFPAKTSPCRQPRNSGPPKEVLHQQDHTGTSTDVQETCSSACEEDKSLAEAVDIPAGMPAAALESPYVSAEAESANLATISTDAAYPLAGADSSSSSLSCPATEAGAAAPATDWQETEQQGLQPPTQDTTSSKGNSADGFMSPQSSTSGGQGNSAGRLRSRPGSSTAGSMACSHEAIKASLTLQTVLVPGTRWSLAASAEGFVCQGDDPAQEDEQEQELTAALSGTLSAAGPSAAPAAAAHAVAQERRSLSMQQETWLCTEEEHQQEQLLPDAETADAAAAGLKPTGAGTGAAAACSAICSHGGVADSAVQDGPQLPQGSFLQAEEASKPLYSSAGDTCSAHRQGSCEGHWLNPGYKPEEVGQQHEGSTDEPPAALSGKPRATSTASMQDVEEQLDLINANVLLQGRRPSPQQQQRQQQGLQGRRSVPAAPPVPNSRHRAAQHGRQSSNGEHSSISSGSSNGGSRGSSAGSSRRSSYAGRLDAIAGTAAGAGPADADDLRITSSTAGNSNVHTTNNSNSMAGTMHAAAPPPEPAAAAPATPELPVGHDTVGHDANSLRLYAEPYRLLQAGNAAYTACQYAAAAKLYQSAMDALQDMPGAGLAALHSSSDTGVRGGSATADGGAVGGVAAGGAQQQQKEQQHDEGGVLVWLKCCLNLACCHLRLGHVRQCVAQCDGLLEVDPSNVVALCHRGRALLMLQQHSAARADFTSALDVLQGNESGKSAHVGFSHVTHMELNSSYWQQRIHGLLASIPNH